MTAQQLAKYIRIDSLKMVHRAKAAHIGSALSIADILAALYGGVLKPEDKVILSKGHATVALYAALKHSGINLDLESYGQSGSVLMHHVSHKVPGVHFSTGSLGHGLPFGVGIAKAWQLQKREGRVYVIMSDGEMQEGSNWEAIQFAAHHKLENLIAIIDNNNLQSITTVEETLDLRDLKAKLNAFGWGASYQDGHDVKKLAKDFAYWHNAPRAIIAETIKGKGVSFMEDKVEWHYKTPTDAELEQAIKEVQDAQVIHGTINCWRCIRQTHHANHR
jgi:transketolase